MNAEHIEYGANNCLDAGRIKGKHLSRAFDEDINIFEFGFC